MVSGAASTPSKSDVASTSSSKSVAACYGCVCKGRCASRKCPCKKDDMLCGSYCHPGRHCVNINFTKTDAPIVYLTKEQGGTIDPPQENWTVIGDTRLTLQDERDLGSRSHQWLTDRHVTAVQHLLKQQHQEVSGLQPTTLQLTRTFDVHRNCEFVQCHRITG